MEKRKNIHLLPTDKGQRITKTSKGTLLWCSKSAEDFIEIRKGYLGFHLYITSDEEIKEDEYYLSWQDYFSPPKFVIYVKSSGVNGDGKKIILTTDQDLIKDGVQAIDDEFLEWFVKNPSCEEVEVDNDYEEPLGDCYKIIIPKEEPKQETLEEAADTYVTSDTKKNPLYGQFYNTFMDGAKWQADRMYSEEEVKHIVSEALQSSLVTVDLNQWFEQFKKKQQ